MLFTSKKSYGSLGKLHPNEWNKKLRSNKNLFKVHDTSARLVGPTLKNGRILGDAFAMESTLFGMTSSKEQQQLFNSIDKVNPIAAKEYILHVINGFDKWKNDVIVLNKILNELQSKIHITKIKEEKLKINEKQIIKHLHEENNTDIKYINELDIKLVKEEIIQTLKKHFSEHIKELNLEKHTVAEILIELKQIETQFKNEEHFIESYLVKLKSEMPFLF